MKLGVISRGCDKATVDSERLVGRVKWQADDVDGITHLEGGGSAQPCDFLTVRIADNYDYDFETVALT